MDLYGHPIPMLKLFALSSNYLPMITFDYVVQIITLKAPNKNCGIRHFNFLLLSFEENKA